MDEDIMLGDIARDKLTGFEGVVVSRTYWLTNCDRLALQPKALDKNGAPQELHSFDIMNCELLSRAERPASTCARSAISLGDVARDDLTGFEGVLIGIALFFVGLERLLIQPKKLKDGQPQKACWFDGPLCSLVSAAVPPAPKAERGGPMPDAARAADTTR